jgi:hypothetical protein
MGFKERLAESNSLWIIIYILLLPIYILVFGLSVSIKGDYVISLIHFSHNNMLVSGLIGFILFALSFGSFYYFIRSNYIYPVDVYKRLPLYLPCFAVLTMFIGLIFIANYDYRFTMRSKEWDWAAIIVCLIFSFIYIVITPPLKSLMGKNPMLREIFMDKEIRPFVLAHHKLIIETNIQRKKYRDMEKIANKEEQERMLSRILDCGAAIETVISLEKNMRLRSRYENTREDFQAVIKLLNLFKDRRVDYTRFIKEETILRTLAPNIKNTIAIFHRILRLDY